MFGDKAFQLSDQLAVTAGGQVSLDSLFEPGEARFLETGDLDLRERLIGDVGQR
jgi:hypothetical protein